MTHYRTFPKITIEPGFYFEADDDAIDLIESVHDVYDEAWKSIVEAPDFVALRIDTYDDRYLILAESVYYPGALQLSYFDRLGAYMHGTYGNGHKRIENLYEELTDLTSAQTITAEIMTA